MSTETRELPDWVQEEIDNPRAMGEGRNNQMIRIGPTLLRNGMDDEGLLDLFLTMFPDVSDAQVREIEAVVQNAVRYVDRDGSMTTAEFIRKKEAMGTITNRFKKALPAILRDWSWTLDEIRFAGGDLFRVHPRLQRTWFLSTLFAPEAILWTGAVWQTGMRKDRAKRVVGTWADRFQPVSKIVEGPIVGEFTSHCTFTPGTYSRCDEAVASRGYLVAESDTLSTDQVGAVFNFLANNGLRLRSVLTTGGKSLHAWYDWPGEDTLDAITATMVGLQLDPACLRASQPVRLPGIPRRDTGRMQELLYLDPPTHPVS